MDSFRIIFISFNITNREYDKDSSWGNNIATDIIVGLLNITLQSTHRNISPDTYTSCAKPDDTICIDSEGNIKEECVLKK